MRRFRQAVWGFVANDIRKAVEEDEDKGIWRIDAFPNDADDARGIEARLKAHDGLTVKVEKLADADWLAMSLSGLPPVRAGRRAPRPCADAATRWLPSGGGQGGCVVASCAVMTACAGRRLAWGRPPAIASVPACRAAYRAAAGGGHCPGHEAPRPKSPAAPAVAAVAAVLVSAGNKEKKEKKARAMSLLLAR